MKGWRRLGKGLGRASDEVRVRREMNSPRVPHGPYVWGSGTPKTLEALAQRCVVGRFGRARC